MGNATIVAAAFALIILVIIAYFLGGIILTTGEVVDAAKKEQVNFMEEKQRTAVKITNVTQDLFGSMCVYAIVENTGGIILSDYPYWDIYTRDMRNDVAASYRYNSSGEPLENEWSYIWIKPDMINPGQLNPSESMNISIHVPAGSYMPRWIKVVVPNGIGAETNI